jgi:hypothetical protein
MSRKLDRGQDPLESVLRVDAGARVVTGRGLLGGYGGGDGAAVVMGSSRGGCWIEGMELAGEGYGCWVVEGEVGRSLVQTQGRPSAVGCWDSSEARPTSGMGSLVPALPDRGLS